MNTDPATPSTTKPRKSVLDQQLAATLGATEHDRVIAVFDSLTPEQWAQPTACTGWDVRAMAGHMLGMVQMAATVPELVRQQVASQRAAKKSGQATIDALTALQVARNADLPNAELGAQTRIVGPRAVRTRRRIVSLVGNRTLPEKQDVDGTAEWWTIGFLFATILTRDPFMHRIDISQAIGVPMQATAEHEGVLVDDVVREWADRHGRAFNLELTGPAGGTWRHGGSAPLVMDAFEFCHVLAGRGTGTGLLATQVPF